MKCKAGISLIVDLVVMKIGFVQKHRSLSFGKREGEIG